MWGQPFFKKNMSWLMPDKRPTDNMELAVDLPQEEEFALANMMPYTYYNFWFLPKYQQEYADKYLLFNDITEKELKVFEEVFVKLIKISLWNTRGTQFLSKNPPHTGRVKAVSYTHLAFYPGKVPFPLMHIDSKWKFKEMIQFRDEYAKKYGWNLIVESNICLLYTSRCV